MNAGQLAILDAELAATERKLSRHLDAQRGRLERENQERNTWNRIDPDLALDRNGAPILLPALAALAQVQAARAHLNLALAGHQ